MQVFELSINDLKEYENNPRINDNAIQRVAESIREYGFKVPVIIDKDNVIICGHTRKKAAELLGLETIPCIKADDLSDEQVKAFRLVDNKTAEFSSWDFRKLDDELGSLFSKGIDLTKFGFNLEALKKANKKKDDYVDGKVYCPRCGAVVREFDYHAEADS